jgi:RNA polymerase sigma-54 factor
MALSQRLLIRQSQALVMTPQLMQAIKLLQLSNLDLVAYVEAELERNPLLDNRAERRARARPERRMARNRRIARRPRAARPSTARTAMPII